MNWLNQRIYLEVLKSRPILNSNLKKKLSLINRLRMLHQNDFNNLYESLKTEDLHKFYREIINSLLSNNKIQKHDDVHKIIKIIYLYSYDVDFIDGLLNELKLRKCESWINFVIWAEIIFLLNEDLIEVIKMVKLLDEDNIFEGIYYLLKYFKNIDKDYLKKIVKKMGDNVIKKKSEMVYQELGLIWDNEEYGKFIEIIKPNENEFKWYQINNKNTTKIIPTNKTKFKNIFNNTFNSINNISKLSNNNIDYNINTDFIKTNIIDIPNIKDKSNTNIELYDFINMIKANKHNIEFLKILSDMIIGQSDLVESILKERKNSNIIPALACIVALLRHGQRDVILRVLKNEIEYVSDNELIFIGELYKFGLVKISTTVELLRKALDIRDIHRFCILFENVGRFMLISQKGNSFGRRFIEELKNIGATGSDKMEVDACLGKIFNPNHSTVSLCDFLHWFFKQKNFVDNNLFLNLKKSPKFMLLCFMQPELFENEKLFAEIVKKTGLENNIVELYLNALPDIFAISKNNLYRVANVLGYLLENRTDCCLILDRILATSYLPTLIKYNVALELLNHFSHDIQEKYLQAIYKTTTQISIKSKIFNLCEKYGHRHLIENIEEDSFEIDMRSMCAD